MIVIPGTDYLVGLSGIDGKPDILPERAVFLNQIHSNRISLNPDGGEEADGMVIGKGKALPALRVADCLPLFALWEDWIGAAHAGWRGLASGIVENLLGSVDQPLQWLVLGPCICSNCYRVGEEVRNSVSLGDPGSLNEHPKNRVDLRGSALRRARKTAGDQFRVIDMDECTFESANLYSFRENQTSERNSLWLAEIERGEHIRQPEKKSEYSSLERRKN